MNRADLQKISELRTCEAEALLAAGLYSGAYYLMGYAVECALKACVAKRVNQYDFPDKGLAQDAFTHDLRKLLIVARLQNAFRRESKKDEKLRDNWIIVRDWSESSRYERSTSEEQARDLYNACTERSHGVLPWIMKQW